MIVREFLSRFGYVVDRNSEAKVNESAQRVRSAVAKIGALFATGAGFRVLTGLAEAASDSAEVVNKFAAVFEQAAVTVQSGLEGIADRTGVTVDTLQEMSSSLGAITKNALGSAEAAGEVSARLSEVALDVASFNNVTAQDAIGALRAGLIGSAEPLQRFGVDIRSSALALQAQREGIAGSLKDMTEGQRVMLRYRAILDQLGTQGAIGDATRTSDQYANASRNLKDQFEGLRATLGSGLLPMFTDMAVSMRDNIRAMRAYLEANRGLLEFPQRVIGGLGKVVDVLRDMPPAFKAAATAGVGFVVSL